MTSRPFRCLLFPPRRGSLSGSRWFSLPLFVASWLALFPCGVRGMVGRESCVAFSAASGGFPLVQRGVAAGFFVDPEDYPGVARAANDLRADIARVTGVMPGVVAKEGASETSVVIVGTLGKSRVIDRLVREGRIDAAPVAGKWEAYVMQVVANPLPGVASGLVIAGSDRRGAIFGAYDLAGQIGVSPWYWWADVPAAHHDEIFVSRGPCLQGPPAVRYRGIFLNDEAPDLTNWVREKFGEVPPRSNPPVRPGVANYGREFYARLFELILRLRANYLWPAMWSNAFNEDDPGNARLADEYGVVMGTSHQEPMLRAQQEWDRRFKSTLGSWNYATHPGVLEDFWREGIRRNRRYESVVTIGLRGADDTPMAPGGPAANMALLERIVGVQRKIIAEEMNPDVARVPQLWCLYKEVQEFYDAGMRVPDDVTLLWCDDNWGDLRRVPTAAERRRGGGAGVYYHFDYHGGPRSYQWINTSPIAKIWEQMSLARQYGADRIWIVNVGHFKGYELPTEFFMDLAWDPDRWTNENVREYTRLWAAREFGPEHAADVADVLQKITRYNGRRKPEMLAPDTYSSIDYREAETVAADFQAAAAKAEEISRALPAGARDAFYELVLFPARAGALVNELYLAAGKNALYARQGRASTNDAAAEVRTLFKADADLMDYFNRSFAGGRWNHFMDQAHLGYTTWRDPPFNSLDAIDLREIEAPDAGAMGVAVEGSDAAWPGAAVGAALPQIDAFNRQRRYLEVFNKGRMPFVFTATPTDPWIVLSEAGGTVGEDHRVWVSVDWDKAPVGTAHGAVRVVGAGCEVSVGVTAFNPAGVKLDSLHGFVEGEGVVSIEAEHFTGRTGAGRSSWIRVEDYGHTLSAMRATAPADAPPATPGKDSPCLEYRMHLFSAGKAEVGSIVAPSLNFQPHRALRMGVSFDDEAPQIVTLVPADYIAQHGNMDWEKCVGDNRRIVRTTHELALPGDHILKIWMVDPGVVIEKLVVNLGGEKPSYLGPPESYRHCNEPSTQQ